MSASESPPTGNTLGNTSLALGIASVALVFGIGLCALTGAQQGWLPLAATVLWVCGASSAFLGLLAAGLGAAGLFSRRRSRQTAVIGLILGFVGLCGFIGVLGALGGG